MKKILFLLIVNIYTLTVFAQIPTGYYNGTDGLSGTELKTALFNIVKNPNVTSYTGLWTAFETTDDDVYYENDGTVLDMYSENPLGNDPYNFTFVSDQCGNYSGESSCYNREHSFPKSWFNEASPMYSDIVHLVPTDGYVNGKRSNFPFGNVGTSSWVSLNGSKLGTCSSPDYSGTVFEPIDEFKGDFARIYFYMATCYEDRISGWSSAALDGTSYPAYSAWYLETILQWHAQDPVSQKEIDRNDGIYDTQGNRNPFVDHPEWVECIWGTGCGVQNPDNFIATAFSETQIDLSWTLNTDNDDVVIAFNTTNTFGIPEGTYTSGQTISGGGEVLYVGNLTSFNHTGLTTQSYYYKIWSINTTDEYSNGIETNATPILPEPANTVANFIVSNETANTISLTWTDAIGGQLPEAYLVKASTGGITPPLDGNPETDAQFVKNVAFGTEAVTFSGLTPSTTYFFEIYPYTNSASNINYKTNSVESAIGNTIAGSTILYSGSFETDTEGWMFYNDGTAPDWERTTDGGQYSPGDDGHDGTYYMWYYGWNGNADDWLISPELDFIGYTDAKFEFWSWMRNSANGILTMKVSTNYPGTGDPNSYTWTDLSPVLATSEFTWTNSGEVDLSAYDGQTCYVAFHYSGTDVDRNWAIDEYSVSGILISTNDNDSEVLEPVTQISGITISSLNDTEAEAVQVFTFQIEDKGTSDGEITQVLNMRIYPGTTNTADWTDHIQAVKLNNGSDINITSLSITDSYLNILTEPIDITDGTAQTFTLSVWLNTNNIEDGSVLSFMIDADNHGFIANNQFSKFATIFNSDIVSENFIIDVETTEIVFLQQASDTEIDVNMSPNPIIKAIDENGNTDLSFNTAVTLSSSGNMQNDPVSGTWNSGTAEFSDIIHTEIGFDFQLTAIADLFEVNSSLFDIYCSPVDVSNLTATCGHAYSEITWTNPDCFDELILVVNDASITGIPSGTYTANSTDYTDGLNPDFPGGGKVVYNGTDVTQTVTGLVNGTNYYFKIFVNNYGIWSTGVETDCMPVFVEDISSKFKLYPNPVRDILTIENVDISETFTVKFYDITGKQILNIISNDKITQIPLNSYSKGFYIIEVSSKKSIYRDCIIIE